MAAGIYRWISDSMGGKFNPRHVEIMAIDATFKPRRTWKLANAALTEVVFPALDTLSQGGAALLVSLEAEQARAVESTGKDKPVPSYAPTKAWPTKRFKLSIDGLGDLAAVTRIDALSFRVGVKRHFVGQEKSSQLSPTRIDTSSLTLTLPERNSDTFFAWLETQLKGTGANEKSGELQYLSDDSKPLLTLNFHGLGISSARKVGSDVKVELYVARMDMS